MLMMLKLLADPIKSLNEEMRMKMRYTFLRKLPLWK